MKAENATEINLKINIIKICNQYQCENETSHSDKGKKKSKRLPPTSKNDPAQTVSSAQVEKPWDRENSRWKEEHSQKLENFGKSQMT